MQPRTLVGIGFGPIQAGLFVFEAWRSGRFSRLVVAEIDPAVVDALRAAGGRYAVNVAHPDGIRPWTVEGIECFNPMVAADREALVDALAGAAEIATALPSVGAYGTDAPHAPAALLAAGLDRKRLDPALPAAVIYAAENHNRAAEILEERLAAAGAPPDTARTQCLNTVIGKMSGVVADPAAIAAAGLRRVAPGLDRAFLVEAFNAILISRVTLPGFERGLSMFAEKPDLLPFEEAKLHGHNAAHAMLGCLLRLRGAALMHEARRHPRLLELVREAFTDEAGAALCRRHAGLDPLFTPAGFRAYADDLIERMLNPHLADSVERVTRDLRRKLAWDDRFAGTARIILAEGLDPRCFALGLAAALRLLGDAEGRDPRLLPAEVWAGAPDAAGRDRLTAIALDALGRLDAALG